MPQKKALEKIPLFPFVNFLRINGEQEMNSQCGGIASIVAICMVLAVLVMKLVEVFKMQTIVSSSQTKMELQPPMTNVSTFQNITNNFPYMAAIGYYQDMFYKSNASSSAFYVTVSGGYSDPARTTVKKEIRLQVCNASHFSVIPNIEQKKSTWGYDSWMCLPLNQVWEIGGDFQLSTAFKRIQFEVNCTYSENSVDCGYYKLYTLNSFINPSDKTNPSIYYISQDTFLIKGSSYYQYTSKLDSNILSIDETVLPVVKLNQTTSLQANPIILEQVMNLATKNQTIVMIEKSPKSTKHNRSFLKLIDALAFVGGIFNSILAVFFFMAMFGRYYFEMKFAEYYFNSKEARDVGFMQWIKNCIYDALSSTPLKLNWQNMQKRNKLIETVNKLLDIFYLHKRISFLEQALSLLLEPHHIKGLYLANSLTHEEACQNFKHHRLRERVVVFLDKYASSSALNDLVKEESQSLKTQNELIKNSGLESNQMLREIAQISLDTGFHHGITNQAQFSQKEQAEELLKESRGIEDKLKEQVRNIELADEELNEEGLIVDMENDFSRLFEEGEREDGDPRSKYICSHMEGWLKKALKVATKQNQLAKSMVSRKRKDQ